MPESNIVQVIICIFAAFGLAVFFGEVCNILFRLGRPCRIKAKLVISPDADEDALKALELAANVRADYFSNLTIEMEGFTPQETEEMLMMAAAVHHPAAAGYAAYRRH